MSKMQRKDAKKKSIIARVRFYDKTGKEFYLIECHDRIAKGHQVAKLNPVEFNAAVLVTCQREPIKKAPLQIFKDIVKNSKVSDTASKKLKEFGADIT